MSLELTTEQKQRDAASYDANAAAFDRLTERFSTPLAREMLALARLRPNDRVLDVGTGTGLVALQAAAAAPEGHATGIDHSAGMLREAGAKAQERGLGQRTEFRRMDAETLDFADASFDVVVSLFVLLHLPDPAAAVREIRRVLRPGGRIVIGVGSSPPLASAEGLQRVVGHLAERVAMARGRLLMAPEFLRDLMTRHGVAPAARQAGPHATAEIGQLLQAVGFRDIGRTWRGTAASLTPEEFWAVQATYGSPERMRLAELPSERHAALREVFLEECRQVQGRGGKLIYRFGAMFHTALV